ncbi:LamG-like jellyroll fold domain-containing protein [Kitasatospora sp. NPDC058032]|uniref:LamG-like jellyroll fold domain-containing protein n=1 Tax=Kitasatospora sp. NPDC058032 TaxID=3346307 RepID=UPI0036DD45E4
MEDTAKRTESTSVFVNPDGTKTVRVYSRPVHYKAADGTWADIDTTLSQTRAGRWREAANDQDVTFAASSDATALLSWQLDAAHQVSYSLKGATAVAGAVSGEQLTYPGVLPGADVVYNGMAQGIKESLVLHDSSAPAVWDFPLALTGLSAAVGDGGQVEFRDEKGDVRLTIPTGFMEDSRIDPASGDGARTGGVTYTLVTENDTPVLRMSLDTSWLKDPNRVYPVKVDPTTTNGINAGQSTFVQNTARANNSADSVLRIGTYDGGTDRFNTYLYFPAVANIGMNYVEAVTLNLNNTHSYECSPHPVNVSQITSGWDPSGIRDYPGVSIGQQLGSRSWSHGDGCGGPAWDWVSLGGSHGDAGVQLVESWAHAGANYGLAVTTSNTDTYSWKKFSSVNTAYPPYLSVVYSDWAASYSLGTDYIPPTANTAGSQQVVMTNLAANWWNSTSMQLKARIFDSNWNELNVNAPLTGVPGLVRTGESVTVTGVIPALPANRSYILCWDGYVGGTASLRDSYGVPTGPCTWISSSNIPPQIDLVEPLSGTSVGTLSPQLYATGHDPDNSPGTGVDYDFKVFTDPSLGSPQLLAESGWQPSNSWKVPSGLLAWNATYQWTVKAGDHQGESLESAPIRFTTSVQQPLITSRLGGAVGNGSTRSFDPQAGNYTTDATDASVTAVGPALAVNRTYNSLDPRTGAMFGAGWSSVYDMSVIPDADGGGGVVLTTANGRTERFGRNDFQLTRLAATGDQTGDGVDDAVAVDSSTGKLWLYPGPDFSQTKRRLLGEGWNGAGRIVGADVTGDGVGDVLAVNTSNDSITLNTGVSGTNLGAVTTLATGGWKTLTNVAVTPPLTTDGRKDLLAVDPATGTLYAYPITAGGSSLGARVAVGSGWNGLREAIGGDFNHDGRGDLAVINTSGHLLLYPGTGNAVLGASTFNSPVDLGGGWDGLRDLAPVDGIPGDPGTDILAVDKATGSQYLYHSAGSPQWSAAARTTTGMPVYTSPAGEFETLAARAGGGYTLADKTGTVYNFAQPSGSGYLLSQITDRQQHTQALHYTGGKLDTVTDEASGRALHFAWTTDGRHVAQVATDPATAGDTTTALTWTYGYDATDADRLAQVCTPPAGTNTARPCTGYAYTSGSHLRSAVLDAAPVSYWRLGEASGTTANSETIANQGTDRATYSAQGVTLGAAGPGNGSPATAATFNGTSGVVTLPRSLLDASAYATIGLWFRTTGQGVLFGYQTDSFPAATTTGNYTPALYVGTSGKLYGELWNGWVNPIASTGQVNDGKWHYALLTASGDTQTLYLDGTAQGTRTGQVVAPGQRVATVGGGFIGGGWPDEPYYNGSDNTGHAGYFNGTISDVAFYNRTLGAPAVSAQWAAAQRPSAELTTVTLPSGKTGLAVSYDTVNDRATQYTDPDGGVWKLNQPTVSGSEQEYRSAVLGSRPGGYWRLAEGKAGQATNAVQTPRPTPNNGTYSNVALGAPGPTSGSTAATFDGTTSWAELPAAYAPTTGTGAFALWFRTTAPGVLIGYQSFPIGAAHVQATDQWNPALYVGTDGKLHGQLWTGKASSTLATGATVTDGKWHQAVLSTDTSTSQTLYLDGQAAGSLAGEIKPNGRLHVYVGAGASDIGWPAAPTDPSGHFNGQIADVAAFDHPVNAAALYAQAANGTAAYDAAVIDARPSGYWRLSDTAGNQATELLTSGALAENQGSYSDTSLTAGGPYSTGNTSVATFNGTTSYVRLPADAAPHIGNTATVEVWFKTAKPGVVYSYQSDPIGGTTPATYTPVLYVGADGRLRGQVWNGDNTNTAVSATAVNDNAWHMADLVVGYANGSFYQQLFVDGAASGSPVSGATKYTSPRYSYLGAGTVSGWPSQPADGNGHFTGQIADFSYYGYALETSTISRHYGYATAPAGEAVTQSGNYRTGVIGSTPEAYWRLNEPAGAGIVQDTLGTALPGQGHGTYTSTNLGVTGPSGSSDGTAASFNGTTSALQLPRTAIPVRGANSIELWFRTTTAGVLYAYQSFPLGAAHAEGVDQWNPALYVGTDGKLHGALWTGDVATALTSTKNVNDNTWHHAVLAGDDNSQTLYLDGAKTAGSTARHTVFANGTAYAYVGAGTADGTWPNHPTSPDGRFTGTIAEVAYYPSVLNADAVTTHYKAMGSAAAQTKLTTATVTDPLSHTLTWRWDTRTGQLTAVTDANAATTRYSYDSHGFLHSVTDPDGHTITTGHDERGNTVSTTTCTDAAHCHTAYASYALDQANPFSPVNDRPLSSSDARSKNANDTTYSTTYTYNALGDPTATTAPATPDFPNGRTATVSYTTGTEAAVGSTGTQPAALPATTTDTAGAATTYVYDRAGNLTRATAPTGLVTSYTYDNLGRRTAAGTTCTDCGPTATTTYTWDGLGNPLTRTDPATTDAVTGTVHTRRTATGYDTDGNRTTQTVDDTTGGDAPRTTTWAYNSYNQLSRTTDPAGRATSYVYDAEAHPINRTDPAGTSWSYTYDGNGRLLRTGINNYTGSPLNPVPSRFQVLEARAYDPAGRLATVTDAMGRTTHTYYNDDNTVAETDLDGYRNTDGTQRTVVLQQNTYDPAGQLVQQTTGGGKTTVVTAHDAAGRTTSTTLDPGGLNRTTAYTYDAGDRVLSATATGGGLTERAENTYSPAGLLLTRAVKGNGTDAVTSHTYNQLGLRTSTTSPNGHATGADPDAYTSTQAYDALGRPTITAGPLVTAETYDPATRAGAPTAGRARTTTGYNTFGEVTATRDPLGTVTTHTYDLAGRRTATTGTAYIDPRTGTGFTPTATTVYDALDRITSSTVDPGGLNLTTSNRYDQLGNLVEQKLPAVGDTVPTWTYSHDLNGEPITATSPLGSRTEATYDDLGRRISATQVERYPVPVALTSTFGYDDAGNQITSTQPKGGITKATYNAAGQPVTVTDPAGLTTRTTYDALGRPQKTTHPDGTAATTAYDALGNAVSSSRFDAAGTVIGTTYTSYDLQSAPTGSTDNVTDPADIVAHTTTRAYDPAGNLIRQTEPVGPQSTITTTFGYDAAGHRTRFTNGKGFATYYTYNSLGLPESTVEPATTAAPATADGTFTTSYDAAGRATTLVEPGGILRRRSYDPLGRTTEETGTGGEAATPTRTLGYDLDGHLTSATAPTGTNAYTYNDRGLLLTSAGPGGNSGYAYDADGNLTGRSDAAGSTTYTYTAAGQLLTAADPLTGRTLGYEYDAAGRLKTTRYGSGGSTRDFGYDQAGRLATDTVKNPAGSTVSSIAYGFDANGRITGKATTGTAGAGQNTYAYDLAGRLTSWTSGTTTTAYTWDAAGNRTSAGGVTSTYDERNELLDDGSNSYTYSPRGTMNSRTVHGAQPTAVRFDAFDRMTGRGPVGYTYDSLDRVTQSGTATFTYDGSSNNQVSDGTSRYSRTPAGVLLATAGTGASPTSRIELTDAHSDVVATFDPATGTLGSSTAYDPFGKPTATNGTGTALGYQSGWTDPTTGDVNMAARWYQPGAGTFTARDSWNLNPSPSIRGNRFTYGSGDPLDRVDPSGHMDCSYAANLRRLRSNNRINWGLICKNIDKSTIDDLTDELLGDDFSGADFSDPDQAYAPDQQKDLFCDGHWWTTTCGGSGSRNDGGGGGHGPGGGHHNTKSTHGHPSTGTPKPKPKPKPNIRPINDADRPKASPNPLNWLIDTVVQIGTPLLTGITAGGATFISSVAAFAGSLLVTGLVDALSVGSERRIGTNPQLKDKPLPIGRTGGRTEDDDESCGDNAGTNVHGNITYLPRERFRPGPAGCRATGAYGHFDSPQDLEDGTGTAWNSRDFPEMVTPPDFWNLPDCQGCRARGHNMGRQFGGSGTDLRNLVPLHGNANLEMSKVENKIANEVRSGRQRVDFEVTDIYSANQTGIPTAVHLQATGTGGLDVDCYIMNVQDYIRICSSERYGW